jgi:hypothetical protein
MHPPFRHKIWAALLWNAETGFPFFEKMDAKRTYGTCAAGFSQLRIENGKSFNPQHIFSICFPRRKEMAKSKCRLLERESFTQFPPGFQQMPGQKAAF